MTGNSAKARLDRGEWVPLDEAFPALVPDDLTDAMRDIITAAAPDGGVQAIAAKTRDSRWAAAGKEHGGNGALIRTPGTPASTSPPLLDRFRAVWSDIDVKVRELLSNGSWGAQRVSSDGTVADVAPLAWRNWRLEWRGENDFSGLFPHMTVKVSEQTGRHVESRVALSNFQIKRSSLPSAGPEGSKPTKRGGAPTRHDWAKAAAIMAAYMLEHGEPGAERGDQAAAVKYLQERMGENGPGETEAKAFVRAIRDEIGRVKAATSNGR
ncbi:hypothetical protein HLH36_02610 [Gluconacetobacter aggeris]|uniref:Uncharacterized protein n=1 Tax=Gluconacetobacter aggeris TaxID=1286186 RepID=A0A7W4IQU6_9PROT|nr:hypothetical protein [Gluconacetobacter aggeris]MBB2167258.1 hypothetical protein [Gluconacetobacter aggeris]